MPFLLQYLLKFSLTLAVLYLFYYVLLRNLTFYRWNRFYLLCYSLLSFVIPFINITPWIRDQSIAENDLINKVYLINKLPAGQAFSFWPYVSALFVAGMLVMVARLVRQFISIQSIRRNATLIKTDHGSLYDVDDHISPFSFARSIFINTRLHSEEELQRIIQHEFVHVKQQHTIDLLIGELLCIVNWYNPFAWLIKKAIRQNLEFIADNSVLQTGVDARHYQYMLLKVTGLPQYSVSSNFNISSLKERIVMINKLKSASVHLLKFMFVLPLLAIMLLAFRGQQERKRQEAELLLQESVSPVSDTVPKKSSSPKFQQPRQITRFLKEHQSVEDVDWKNNNTSGNTVILKLKNGKSETYDLNRKEENEDFIKKYGASLITPPPPPPLPPPPPPPVPGEGVQSITKNGLRSSIVNYVATVTLKNGKKEVYDLHIPKEKAAYEKKYGKIPPPPPPVPPAQSTVMLDNIKEEKYKLDYLAEKAAYDKQKATHEKVEEGTYDVQKAIYAYEKAAYEKQKAIYEKEKTAYEKKYGKVTPPPTPARVNSREEAMNEQEKALNEIERAMNENEKAQFEKERLVNEKEKAAFEKERLINEKEKAQFEEERLINEKKRAVFEKERLANEKEKAAFQKKYGKIPPPTPPAPPISVTADTINIIAGSDTSNLFSYFQAIGNGTVMLSSHTSALPSTLYIVDGKKTSQDNLSNINPAFIQRMDVLNGKNAVGVYGEKGKEGVVIITTKQKTLNLNLHDN